MSRPTAEDELYLTLEQLIKVCSCSNPHSPNKSKWYKYIIPWKITRGHPTIYKWLWWHITLGK